MLYIKHMIPLENLTDPIFLLICSLFFIVAALAHLVFVTGKLLAFIPFGRKREEIPPVSIIVTSRNCHEGLKQLIPQLTAQNYPDFEIVIVNDCSTDDTEHYLLKLSNENSRIKCTEIKQETDFPNALALTVGVRAASKEWLIFLGPQCQLPGSDWLASMAQHCTPERHAVVGFAQILSQKGFWAWVNRGAAFSRFVNFCGANYYGLSMPVSDINIAYRKDDFLTKRGFAAQLDAPFCENELFLNKLAFKNKVAFSSSAKTTVYINTKVDRFDWLNLKKKQLLLRKKFFVGQRIYLWLDKVSGIMLNLTFLVLVLFSPYRWTFLAARILLLSSDVTISILASNALKQRSVVVNALIMKFFNPVLDELVRWNQYLKTKRKKWK